MFCGSVNTVIDSKIHMLIVLQSNAEGAVDKVMAKIVNYLGDHY